MDDDSPSITTGARRFLTFRVARRLYALASDSVAEVIRIPPIARVPQAPNALLGVANLRGIVMPIVSLRVLLDIEDLCDSIRSRAIVLDTAAHAAIVVDSIEEFITVEPDRVKTPPAHPNAEPSEPLIGMFAAGDALGAAKILDVQSLLDDAFAKRSGPRTQTAAKSSVTARQRSETTVRRELLITFDVANQEFALDLSTIIEVVGLPEHIAAVPRAEELVLGIVPFRDQLLPLVSLRGLLGFTMASGSNSRERVVVAVVGGALVGLVADRARAVLSADPDLIDPVPPFLSARVGGEALIKAIYRSDQGRRLISILAPERLFREDVMQRLGSRKATSLPNVFDEKAYSARERKILVFRLGDDEFGLPIEAVDEVARVPDQITRVPKSPPFLEGVINMRGTVLPVVDQRRRFDMPSFEQSEQRRLIVVRTNSHRAGLIVDSVLEVLNTAVDSIEAAPELTGNITRLIDGVINLEGEGRIVLLLDPAELLTRAEHDLLDAFEKSERAPS
jgi:purine-binding chemotaxis protein CheW